MAYAGVAMNGGRIVLTQGMDEHGRPRPLPNVNVFNVFDDDKPGIKTFWVKMFASIYSFSQYVQRRKRRRRRLRPAVRIELPEELIKD